MLECSSCHLAYDEEVYSKECPHNELPLSLEERVESLEKALATQDTIHKMNIRAISRALRCLLVETKRIKQLQLGD